MNPTTADPEAGTARATAGDLFDNLRELGQALPVNFQPTSHDAPALTAGIIYYLATGSLVPPVVVAPDEQATRIELAEQTRLNEAEAEIANLRRQLAAQDTGPSPVAPAPVAEAPAPPVPAAPPVASEPTPIAPVPGTAQTPSAEPALTPESLAAAEALIAKARGGESA